MKQRFNLDEKRKRKADLEAIIEILREKGLAEHAEIVENERGQFGVKVIIQHGDNRFCYAVCPLTEDEQKVFRVANSLALYTSSNVQFPEIIAEPKFTFVSNEAAGKFLISIIEAAA